MDQMIDDKAQDEVMGDVLHGWQALVASFHIKPSQAQKGKAACLSLLRYKISIENNCPSILGQAYRHKLPC